MKRISGAPPCPGRGRVAVVDDAVAVRPRAVVNAAGERPAAADPVAAVRNARLAAGVDGARHHRPGVRPRDGAGDVLAEVRAQGPVHRPDRQTPAGRAVDPRDLLDGAEQGHRVDLEAAQRLRDVHAEQVGLRHRRHQWRGQPSGALDLVPARPNARSQGPGGGNGGIRAPGIMHRSRSRAEESRARSA